MSFGAKTIRLACAKYNLGGNIFLHAAMEKILLKQLFCIKKQYQGLFRPYFS